MKVGSAYSGPGELLGEQLESKSIVYALIQNATQLTIADPGRITRPAPDCFARAAAASPAGPAPITLTTSHFQPTHRRRLSTLPPLSFFLLTCMNI